MKTSFVQLTAALLILFQLSACAQSGSGNNKPATGAGNPKKGPWTFSLERDKPVACNFNIQVDGATPDMKTCKLVAIYGNQNYIVDTAIVQPGGIATFKKQGGYLSGFYYAAFTDNDFIQVLLDDDQEFTIKTKKGDYVNSTVVEGCLENELLYQNLKFQNEIDPKFTEVQTRMEKTKGTPAYEQAKADQKKLLETRRAHIKAFVDKYPENLFTKFKVAGQNPDIEPPLKADGEVDNEKYLQLYRGHFWDGVDFGDVRLLRTPVLHNKLQRYVKELTPQVADTLVKYTGIVGKLAADGHPEVFKHMVNWMAIEYQKSSVMGGQAVFVHLVDKYFTPERAFWTDSNEITKIRRTALDMKPSLLGMTGQDIRAKDTALVYRSLYELNAPYLVVFIYTYECDHCKEAAPKMARLYNELKPKGVEFFGLCTGADMGEFKKFIRRYRLPFHNVYDPNYESKYYLKYHIDITPEIYVIDKNRKIIAKDLQPEQIGVIIERDMKKGS